MMFNRRRRSYDAFVAKRMAGFFKRLSPEDRSHPKRVARLYGSYFWNQKRQEIIDRRKLTATSFDIGISAQSAGDFSLLTKRAALVSDRLLLSHDLPAGEKQWKTWKGYCYECSLDIADDVHDQELGLIPDMGTPPPDWRERAKRSHICTAHIRLACPSLKKLGKWILNTEPMLRSGVVWYLPNYSADTMKILNGGDRHSTQTHADRDIIDFLANGRQVVDDSGATPLKSRLVRPILEVELPFVDGVDLHTFSRITVEEFNSYRGFQSFLRQSFLSMDDALEAVQSERELAKLGLQIVDQIREVRTEMKRMKSKRALSVSGAAVGTVGAVLVAVYGPALREAVTTVGATGGIWALVQAMTESRMRRMQDDKWYYAWVLSEAAQVD